MKCWVHELQVNANGASPPLQEKQQPDSAAVDTVNHRQINYYGPSVPLRQHSLAQNIRFLANHDAPHAT